MVNLCYTCLKWADRQSCPLYEYGSKYISVCSAYLHSGINVTLKLQERIENLESHVKDLKEKYYKTYQTIYTGLNESRIEVLESRINYLEDKIDRSNESWDEHIINVEKQCKLGEKNIFNRLKKIENHPIFEEIDADNIIYYNSPLSSRFNKIEDKIKKLEIQWAEQQGELDEVFNRLAHHSAFYDRFTRIEKILGKFMELLVNPSDSTYAVREFYRKLKKLIRELKR